MGDNQPVEYYMAEPSLLAQPLGAVDPEEEAPGRSVAEAIQSRDDKLRKAAMRGRSLLSATLRTTLRFPPSLLPDSH